MIETVLLVVKECKRLRLQFPIMDFCRDKTGYMYSIISKLIFGNEGFF